MFFFEFYPTHCTVKNQVTKEILLQGILKEGNYVFSTLQRSLPPTIQHTTTGSSSIVPLDVWHARMGHVALNTVKRALYAFNIGVKMNSFFCDSCVIAKIHQLPYHVSNTQYMKPLEMIFIDIWGPAHEYSIDGHQYYISFVDACSKFTWLYLMHAKSQALDIFLKFKLLVENQLGHKIKNIQSDNAREFISFDKTLALFGIHHRYTCPHTHQQNGVVERKHRHIVETGLSLLAHESLPLKYWSYAFKAVVFIINNLPTSILHHQTPHTILYNHPSTYNLLRVFGCACFALLRPYNKYKFDFKSHICLFLGYAINKKGYLYLHPNGKIYVSRNVLFKEGEFPYKTKSNLFEPNGSSIPASISSQPLFLLSEPHSPTITHVPQSPTIINTPQSPTVTPLATHNTTSSYESMMSSSPTISSPNISNAAPASTINMHPMQTRAKSGVFKPNVWTTTVSDFVPVNPKTTIDDPEWKKTMDVEYDALIKNNTWTLVDPSFDAHIITCKWIFKNNYNPDGSLQRRKARLVAHGFDQIEGIDYFDTFNPVVHPVTIRTFLALVVSHKWSVQQLDVNNAFLNGDLQELVYMQQPYGFTTSFMKVCRLNKAIYGLKQAPHAWHHKLSSTLVNLGFKSTISDPSLFVHATHTTFVIILIYVDDILITGSSSTAIRSLISTLSHTFALKDLGKLHYFLGIET